LAVSSPLHAPDYHRRIVGRQTVLWFSRPERG
jgi:hypothetical protein